ncbi:internal (core) protein [Enterobacter phage 03_vB_Eclo_IJM]|nr:internal (core) protein [Enterobacter phage 03_vB_Eclo_IJM]
MYIRKATEPDVHYFLWHLSADDVNECKANYGSTVVSLKDCLAFISVICGFNEQCGRGVCLWRERRGQRMVLDFRSGLQAET